MHARHRAHFLSALGEDAALIFTHAHHLRNGDAEYRFRGSSDVLYLSGWAQAECALLFRPGADAPFVMFVQARDPKMEVWTGRRPGPEGAMERFGADEAFPWEELADKLPSLLQGYRNLHYRFAEDMDRDRMLVGAIAKARRAARRNGLAVPDAFFDPGRILHELRLVKSSEELDLMQKAADITAEAHCRAMKLTAPGVHEYALEAEIEGHFRRSGGNGPGYTTIVGGGVNATILHYIENQDVLNDGDLVCVDAGCEYGFYTADVTRTWPVSGRFNEDQKALYQVVLDAQIAAIDCVRVGRPVKDVHDVATRVLTEGMVRLGLLEGDAEDPAHIAQLIDDEAHKRFYMHGTSHWLGLDVHDVGAYHQEGESRVLEAGMVLTIEPGLYVAPDDEEAPIAYRGIGIRIEDDVAVTAEGPRVLTSAVPKTVEAVEAMVAGA
jgi:Xaa-Pro aminopeptidase